MKRQKNNKNEHGQNVKQTGHKERKQLKKKQAG